MQPGWIPEVFSTSESGVSSAFDAELIPQNQLAWMKNGRIRGGKAHTRPFLKERMILPTGLIQGASYFSIQDGMLVVQVDGKIYRVRINTHTFSYEPIPLEWDNSGVLPYAWMQETVGNLVIQDGQSYPIIYDGSTARRADPAESEVPRGTVMAYGNGRLWVAVNENEVVAGDIKTKTFQSELKFTESQYFSGGGAFYFPFAINGMAFVPASGGSGYGSLLVYGKNQTHGVRADIAQRDLWPDYPGFIQPVLLSTGAVSHFSLVEVNQDLYWRDGFGGLRSLRSSVTDENGPGNAPISREISRITDHESVHRLGNCSAIYFGNRLIMTASPFINIYGQTSYRDLVSLDFAPMSSMRGKSPPSYDGEWEGLNFVRLLQGQFRGERRAFVLTTDSDQQNRLWEIVEEGTGDQFLICVGTSYVPVNTQVPVVMEFPARDWGMPKDRKRLDRCDVYLSELKGEIELEVYWRADNYQKWNLWDGRTTCASTTDPATDTPHVFKNVRSQERPQIMTFTIPYGKNEITERALDVGFEFQIRLVLRGYGKINRLVVLAKKLEENVFSDDDNPVGCAVNDVTGNEINYHIDDERFTIQNQYLYACTCPPVEAIIYGIDDFESYDLGELTNLAGGFGRWADPCDEGGVVYSRLPPELFGYDDIESYPLGDFVLPLNAGVGFLNA